MEAKSYEQEVANIPVGGQVLSSSKVITGASEILTLLRVLGDGFRLACLYKCKVLTNYCFCRKNVYNFYSCIYYFFNHGYEK
jgi:anaphase-promoting complex subunit 3